MALIYQIVYINFLDWLLLLYRLLALFGGEIVGMEDIAAHLSVCL
ncbi:cell division FtsK domain protein [Rickettsia amblyommatis str. Ac/Pa]|uniref:Cell division FtsK domain protein n=1 Tax=Rickettsia amblyommatis str. Ac/Pa TaxID=1359164 RepID=A0A0F3MZP1_RICAM|nr:cell division FtsK domain protein [Rickettsia amblyommatis str. Ac/Pa]